MTRHARRIVIGLVFVSVALTAVQAFRSAAVAGILVDHFLCYRISRGAIDASVSLATSQFGSTTALVRRAQRLCAPADKSGEDVTAPDHPDHLTGYSLQPRTNFPERRHQVIVNQFGTLTADLIDLDFLLVPTGKSTSGPPVGYVPAVDHFECFRTIRAHFTKSGIDVEDQFGTRTVDVRRPTRLCVPVDKDGEGILVPNANLLCYRVSGQPRVNGAHVFTTNQFGSDEYNVGAVRELCVPSQLIASAPTATPTATLSPGPGTPTPTDTASAVATDTPAGGGTPSATQTPGPNPTDTTEPGPTATPVCGNGTCDAGEDSVSCPLDCHCGDGTCDVAGGEDASNCPADCYCGDNICDPSETGATCPSDCPCGDGTCDVGAGEDASNCPADCTCGDGICDPSESTATCPVDCACGDGFCDISTEDTFTCPTDCFCGDGVCDDTENDSNCGTDCGCGSANLCGTQLSAPAFCYCNESCVAGFDCCADACDVCGVCG
jgi:hypothetical protein